MSTSNIRERRNTFLALHERGCFVIPNPWDVGSALALQDLGFKALASTSAGYAFSRGLPDADPRVTRESVLEHLRALVAATSLPIHADFQSGFGATAAQVAESVGCCAETGVAGLSIEDGTGEPGRPLFELSEAVDRIRAARRAIDAYNTRGLGSVMLTGRAECFLVHHPDALRESIRRLQAYAEAGADVLFAPGAMQVDEIKAITSALPAKPINVLIGSSAGMPVAELAALGVRRISVGGALARAAWGGFFRAARKLASAGSFAGFDGAASFAELNEMFSRSAGARETESKR